MSTWADRVLRFGRRAERAPALDHDSSALGPEPGLRYADARPDPGRPSLEGAMRQGTSRTSDILVRLVEDARTDRVPVRAIVDVLGERAYALLIVVLGLPNCLPMPPPIPLLCGLLLLSVAVQIILGQPSPWLPNRLLVRTIALHDLRKAVDRAVPWLRKLERFARPRLSFFERAVAFRLVGAALLAFALALVFAAPIIGQIPLGIAVVLVGLGLVERDGVVVIAGLCFGLVGTVLSLGFLFAIIASASAIF